MRSDRIILIAVPVLAVIVGFWLLVVSPKQKESGQLQDKIDELQASITTAEAEIATAEAAREAFPENYSELVTLGKAVPEDGDQSTLVYDLVRMSSQNEVGFQNFNLSEGQAGAEATQPAPAPTEPSTTDPAATDSTTTTATPAVATEATAATLPIGATVGPAGLPVMPYEFKFAGDFFHMADFFADLDKTVSSDVEEPEIRGRLLTVDGFSLTGDPTTGFPRVEANFAVTSYVVPPEQGLSAGATPAGPAVAGSPSVPTTVSAPTDTAVAP